MGTYLNPGKDLFERACRSEIFVDKTEMIAHMNSVVNTNQCYVCVSRPRRFGKTMATNMLCAYYGRKSGSRELFSKLKIASTQSTVNENARHPWDEYLERFDVLRVVMTDFFREGRSVADALDSLQTRLLEELDEAYPGTRYDPKDFMYSLDRFSRKSGHRFVVVIDEWDAIFRVWKNDHEGQKRYLDFLRDWMKDRPYIALAYMTGILPIKKYGKHSALNMFDEYSMMAPMQLAPSTGFTEGEVLSLCRDFGRPFDPFKDWYDGYIVKSVIPPDPGYTRQKMTNEPPKAETFSLYSPFSVVKAIQTGIVRNYWNKTETYEALAEYIRMDYDGLKDAVALLMDNGRLKIDTSTYQNDMTTFHGRDDILSLLVHLGYLGFDDETSEVFIPNREILDEFKTSTKSPEWISAFKSFEISQRLLKATWDKDAEKVAELLEDSHNRTGNKSYNDEAALSYAIQYAYYAAQKYYTTILELDSGKGYADIVFLPAPSCPNIPALHIELKYNKSSDTALSQIKRQKYPDRLEHYKGNLLLVAIDYDKEASNTSKKFKRHTCIIEEA